MKNLLSISALSALAALVLLPINVQLSASVIAAAGILAVVCGDYSREIKPLSMALVPCARANRSSLRLAA